MKKIRVKLKPDESNEINSVIRVFCAGTKTEYDANGNVSGKYTFKPNPITRNKGSYYK